jgi:hypothetical protein
MDWRTLIARDELQDSTRADERFTQFAQFVEHFRYTIHISEMSLVELLYSFRGKDCSLVQDRIFSLLAISKDSVPGRYDISKAELAYSVLRHSQPRTTCLCPASILVQVLALGTPDTPMFDQMKEAFLKFQSSQRRSNMDPGLK